MAKFSDLSTPAGLKELDAFLLPKSYITGHQASKDDLAVFNAISNAPNAKEYPNAARWFSHITALLNASFPGKAAGVTIAGGAAAAGGAKGGKKGGDKKKAEPKKKEAAKELAPGEFTDKQKAAAVKEGGKKGIEVGGAADMGGLDFFCSVMEKSFGSMDLLKSAMEAMNQEADPNAEEMRGGSGHIGKLILCSDNDNLQLLTYVPKEKLEKVTATVWMTEVLKMLGVKSVATGTDTLSQATVPKDSENNKFPVKMRDEAIAFGIQFLKANDCWNVPDTDSDDENFAGEFEW